MSKVSTDPKIFIQPVGEELTIRQGDAIPYKPKKSINITGTLAAPHQFLIGRGEQDQTKAHLKIYNDVGKLELVLQDTDPETTHTVTGKLTKDNDLQSFGINTTLRWTVRDFSKHIRERRYFFYDKDVHNQLLKTLQTWSVQVERVLKEFNNDTGNSLFQLETKVRAVEGLVTQFYLHIPIYQGYPKQKFLVEIGLDPSATAVTLYLVSDELFQLERDVRDNIMNSEVDKFSDYFFAKVLIS